jgi:hypothetical protein
MQGSNGVGGNVMAAGGLELIKETTEEEENQSAMAGGPSAGGCGGQMMNLGNLHEMSLTTEGGGIYTGFNGSHFGSLNRSSHHNHQIVSNIPGTSMPGSN